MASTTQKIAALLAMLLVGCGDCSGNNENNDTDAGMTDDGGLPDGIDEPFDPTSLGWGLHVVSRGADDIFVAGGTPERGVILHYDGSEWAPETLPDGTPLMNWVVPFEGDRAVAVGNGGRIISYDGSQWTSQPTPTVEDLWGVWGANVDDLWAVGGRGREDGQATVLRWEGTEWTVADVPVLARPGVNAFFKVWGTGADNVYIVGQNGGCLHYDGAEITEFGVGTAEDLISLWGTGPDDIMLVGGRGNGVLSHFNGTDWHTESISPAPGINGIWMPAPGEFWLAGARGLLRRGTVTADVSGERTFEVTRVPPLSEIDLHAVTGVPGYGLIAVGGNFERPDGPYEGLAVRRAEDWE